MLAFRAMTLSPRVRAASSRAFSTFMGIGKTKGQVDEKSLNEFSAISGDLCTIAKQIGGDLYSRKGLDDKSRKVATLAIQIANFPNNKCFKWHIRGALEAELLTPDEITELIIHTVPYTGFPQAIEAANSFNEVLREKGLPTLELKRDSPHK
eukprot:gb/GEZN01019806.1/.p1 GENE.gb/GEZN01019806.1/~~gb/GEZN01019806.1/.p1  ORF type:complete len:152 (-),score=20.13 gb/GEZN01019806.1/:67-522(-)